MPAQMRRSVRARVVRCVKVREALEAEGRVRRVGTAMVLSVYERPWDELA
jgi:hypothetical protein